MIYMSSISILHFRTYALTINENCKWYSINPIYQSHCSSRIWHKVNFYAEFNRFEFRVFLLLD